MNRKLLNMIIATGAVASLTGSALVFAQATTTAKELTIKEVIQKLEAAGYTNIDDVEKDDGHWEAEATNRAGERVDVDIDGASGKVIREERDS